MLFYSTLTFGVNEYFFKSKVVLSTTDKFMFTMAISDTLFLNSSVTYQFCYQKHLLKTLHLIKSIDKTLKQLNCKFSFVYINILNSTLIITLIIFMVVMPAVDIYNETNDVIAILAYNLLYYGGYMLRQGPCYLYFVIVCLLIVRIDRTIKVISRWDGSKMNCAQYRHQLGIVSKLYVQFGEVSEEIDKVYALNLLFSILVSSLVLLMLVVVVFSQEQDKIREISFWSCSNCMIFYADLMACTYATFKVLL